MINSHYGSILHHFWDICGVSGHSRSLKLIPFIQYPAYGFLLAYYSNFVSKMHLFEIFAFEKYRDLETRV